MLAREARLHPQGDAFFHPLDCEPTLQIGYQHGSCVWTAYYI
ncbi:hypothetical protein Leryth_009922 [Lithospermum erythrorhizon]|nr:hypothetical protein Leryth_009922 [Lithospermum erythrorhizon]